MSAASSTGRCTTESSCWPCPSSDVVLLELDRLRLERGDDRVRDLLRRGHPHRREAQAVVDRREPLVGARRQAELVLDRAPKDHPAVAERGVHAFEEGPRAGLVGLAVQPDVVDEHGRRVRRVREDPQRRGIGDQPDLADRAHPLHRLELVERAHGLHRDGQADPGPHPVRQPLDVRGLGPHDAAVVAVQEPDEADPRLPADGDRLVRRHARRIDRSGARHVLRDLPLGLPELDQLLVGLALPRVLARSRRSRCRR